MAAAVVAAISIVGMEAIGVAVGTGWLAVAAKAAFAVAISMLGESSRDPTPEGYREHH